MTLHDATTPPQTNPTLIFEHFRGSYGSELLTAAVAHFNLFGRLAKQPLTQDDLAAALGLQERPAVVLITALRAMGLLEKDEQQRLTLSPLAREHLVPGGDFDVGGYVALAAESPGVLAMVERLRTNRPAVADDGAGVAVIYREGAHNATQQEMARNFTLALAGRAKNVAPHLAQRVPLVEANVLLDVGGGSGIYSIALLQANPHLRAVVFDHAEVLQTAREFAAQYDVGDRLQFLEGDMFADAPLPQADAVLLSNVLHDWDVADCRALVAKCAAALTPGGQLLIHDVFLNDELDGPLPLALYSAALFTLTEGRAYSAAEYRLWLEDAGLAPQPIAATLVHCGVLAGVKPG